MYKCYLALETVHKLVCQCEKARDHFQKSLAVQKEIGNMGGEAASYIILGKVYKFVGEDEKAADYNEKLLTISRRLGDRYKVTYSCLILADQFFSLGKYSK